MNLLNRVVLDIPHQLDVSILEAVVGGEASLEVELTEILEITLRNLIYLALQHLIVELECLDLILQASNLDILSIELLLYALLEL